MPDPIAPEITLPRKQRLRGLRILLVVSKLEFVMMTRSRVAWMAVLPLLAISGLAAMTSRDVLDAPSASSRIGTWALLISMFATVGAGVAMSDRLVRTHGMGLDELLTSLPCPGGARLFGGLFGAIAATLVPAALTMGAVGIGCAVIDHDVTAVASAAAAFAIVIVPSAIFLSSLAALGGLVAPLPLVRALTVIAWFWMTLFNRNMIPLPSPTGTLFSPLGDYATSAFWGVSPIWAGRGAPQVLSPAPTEFAVMLNLAIILLMTVVALVIAYFVARWRAIRI